MKAPLLRFSAAIALAAIAALAEILFPAFFAPIPFFPFWVTVFVAAITLGFAPAVVSTLLAGVLTATLMQVRPAYTIFFIISGIAVSWLLASRRRSERHEIETLTEIASVAPAIVWVTDANKSCIYVNDRWLEFSGRTREEELGFGWIEEMHPDDIPACMPVFETNFALRKPVEIEYRQRRHDGVYRWMLSRAVPRFDRGKFSGYIGIAIDVDDLRTAEARRETLAREVVLERERLRSIVSNVPGVVWEAWGEPDAASQRINFVSDHVETLLGYTKEEWLSTPNFWLNIVHPDDREAAAKHAHEHFLAGGASTNNFRWMTKDGRAISCEAHSTVITGSQGKPIGMRGVTLDVTARRRAEDSLRFLARASDVLASSLDYQATLEATARLAVPTLADWCMVTLNDAATGEGKRAAIVHRDPLKHEHAQRMLAMSRRVEMPPVLSKPLGRNDPFYVDLNDELIRLSADSDEQAALVRELGAGSTLIVPIAARDRVLGSISFVSATPGRYDEADLELGMLLGRRVAIAIDNANLYRTAVNASAAKDEFLATISHELRTPMTAILGWVRLLTGGFLDAETTKTALHTIEHSTLAQAKLIEDILDVSSIILGKFRLERAPLDLRMIVDAATEALTPTVAAKSITINVDSMRWHGVVFGDADRLQQVVWNLISNAAKFGRRDGVIDVIVEREGDIARVIVRDDGAGIDPEFLPHVFDRFRQAESGFTRAHGGLGLGLAIVRHLVELHGGTVRATSGGRGKGSTFTIELPATVEAAAQDESSTPMFPNLKEKQVLIVDDEQATLDFVAAVLRQCGASVTMAHSAHEALLAIRDKKHDVVVTDISMPEVDGVAMLREARANGALVPAIALTALHDLPLDGFARVLRKPIDPFELAAHVAAVIAKRD